jgi:hypothetical protein
MLQPIAYPFPILPDKLVGHFAAIVGHLSRTLKQTEHHRDFTNPPVLGKTGTRTPRKISSPEGELFQGTSSKNLRGRARSTNAPVMTARS